MSKKSTRFSHRHLLALGTFLVPLIVLAVLGWNELQRSGEKTMALSDENSRRFLARVEQAITQKIDSQVGKAVAASERLLMDLPPTRTAIQLREDEGIPALLDVIVLDDVADLVWPKPPLYTITMPFVEEPTTDLEGKHNKALVRAEVLIEHGDLRRAVKQLEKLLADLEIATRDDEGRRSSPRLSRTEAYARFRLGAVLRALEETTAAIKQLKEVESLTLDRRLRSMEGLREMRLMARTMRVELGSPAERLALLRDIAEENGYAQVADGLSSAIALRMARSFDPGSAEFEEVERYLAEDEQRAASRVFADDYSIWFKYLVRPLVHRPGQVTEPIIEKRLISTDAGYPMLLVVRAATQEEIQRENQWAYVALHFDLSEMINPVLASISDADYTLSITDPRGGPLLTPEKAAPKGFVAPSMRTNDLTLRVFPADPERLMAEADSAATKRTLLVLALLFTAIGGALWSWRSVSREAELAALKISLVSRVSHELKTPLALIRMYGETIGMGRVRDQGQTAEFGSIIARESERLTTLIQRILDFSRQQAGTLTYQTEPYDIGELLRSTAYAYAPHLEEKGVILIDSLPLGIVVSCDKDGLEGAIINLLENATKYGHNGDTEHEVDLILQTIAGQAVIEVQDRGRGIPNGEHKRIFEGFYRASNSGEVRGAGLGLGIVQHFTRAHDGDIEALPREGGGTIMRLTLPLAKRNTTRNSTASHAPNRTPGTPT
ncbi:MAG: signal transduction histidine kinase [Planctomycetota bacterium]|jgi:signal transduction histidine kinase